MKSRLILFLLIMNLGFNASLLAQSKKEYVQYLKSNFLEITDSVTDWVSVLDSSFYKNDFFWIGETHGIKYSYDAEWILFKKLHEKVRFKYYLLETGYISELYLNKYLETGDEKYLKNVFNATSGTMGCNMDAYEFYRKFYLYNLELPEENRIEFVSIDIEHQYIETDKYIRSLFQNQEIPKDTSDFINIFLRTKGDYKSLYEKLSGDLHSDSIKYKMVLRSDYSIFWYLVRNINYLFQAKASNNWNQTRDSLMFENYKIRLLDHDFKKSKVFAYFGTSHCYLEKTNHVSWIASLINKSTPAIKSTSIMMLYSDCKAMRPVWIVPKSRRLLINNKKDYVSSSVDNDWKNILGRSSGKGYALFKIINNGSPFNTSKLFVYDSCNDKFTADYFQYILYIKDSPASAPYKE
jgi:hypothetical protein